jgi:endonuclease/exonuclease/phosphatase family metal-dependent hydrolase
MRFLFWNIQKKDSFFETIVNIVDELSVDVLGLAEFPNDQEGILISSFSNKGLCFKCVKNANFKVKVFYRDGVQIINKYEGDYINATEVSIGGIKYSVLFCHLSAKNMSTDIDPFCRAALYYEELESYEQTIVSHNRTIVVGDFNMNPFDSGMVSAMAFNATNSMAISKRGSRELSKKKYHYFYNPTWNLHGDQGKEIPAASFYFGKADYGQLYWHMLDQVIIRPEVISHFIYDDFRLVYKGKSFCLINSDSTINANDYSDHLPIVFSIN